jgi:hypothetical protein
VTLADGTQCRIADVRTGDKVMAADGVRVNTVMFVERLAATHWSHLYSPDPHVAPFATVNHPLVVDGELVSPHPQNVKEFYPWLKRVRKLDGVAYARTTEDTVYNLWVTGDGTYRVNGFGTHCIAGTGGLLRRLHDCGELTYDEVLRAAHYFAKVPKDRRLGAKRLNDWLENIPLSSSGRRRMAMRLREASSGEPGGLGTRIFRLTCSAIGCAELLIDGAARRRSADPMTSLTRELRT